MSKNDSSTRSIKLLIIVVAIASALTIITYFFSARFSEFVGTQGNSISIAIFSMLVIWIVAAAVGITIASWNKSLRNLVRHRTAELEKTNQDSAASNIQLREKLSTLAFEAEELERTNSSLSSGIERLQADERLQREFVNIAAHELRTPVQPILGMADLLEAQFEEGKENIEMTKAEAELIVRNARRLERLTSDILQVARIESGTLKLKKERFSLDMLISAAIIDAKIQFRPDNNHVKILYEPSGIFLVADSDRISEVLQNLLSNAIKFTESGTIAIDSQITIDDVDEDNRVTIRVKDSGTGIDPEVLPYVFAKFVTKSDKGTGLGLYIARSIVQAHGGRIWGMNNEDVGATFSFTIPLEEQIEKVNENKLQNNNRLSTQ